jgi:hypothetical protein
MTGILSREVKMPARKVFFPFERRFHMFMDFFGLRENCFPRSSTGVACSWIFSPCAKAVFPVRALVSHVHGFFQPARKLFSPFEHWCSLFMDFFALRENCFRCAELVAAEFLAVSCRSDRQFFGIHASSSSGALHSGAVGAGFSRRGGHKAASDQGRLPFGRVG